MLFAMHMFNEYCNDCYHCIAKTCTNDTDCSNGESCIDHDNDLRSRPVCDRKIITQCCYSESTINLITFLISFDKLKNLISRIGELWRGV